MSNSNVVVSLKKVVINSEIGAQVLIVMGSDHSFDTDCETTVPKSLNKEVPTAVVVSILVPSPSVELACVLTVEMHKITFMLFAGTAIKQKNVLTQKFYQLNLPDRSTIMFNYKVKEIVQFERYKHVYDSSDRYFIAKLGSQQQRVSDLGRTLSISETDYEGIASNDL